MSRHTNGGGRWDTERFMRESDVRNGSPRRERGRSVAVAERERERDDKKRQPMVEDYLREQEKYHAPARRPDRDYNDAHLVGESDALVPFEERRRRSPSPVRPPTGTAAPKAAQPRQAPPARPRLLKRQSSLDTFHRAANRRAQDNRRYNREADRPPPVAPVPPRRRSPSQVRERPADLDEISVAERDYYGDERFRRVREREPSAPPPARGRRTSVHENVVHEKADVRRSQHQGKTRVPKRFMHPRAMIDLGYPYEDEGDSYVIFRALGKENIDELLALSEGIKREARSPSNERREADRVKVGTRESDVAFERRRSRSLSRQGAALVMPAEKQHRRVYSPSSSSPSPSPAHRPRRVQRSRRLSSPMPPRQQVEDDVIVPRADMALALPEHRGGSELVRRERSGSRPPEVAEVRQDYKDPSPRMIRAMMTALT